MKHTRRIASLLLALVMVFAMATTAFAQDVGTDAEGKGTITISNAAKGETYTIYKLFDATVNADGTSIAYTGEIPETLASYFTKDETTGAITATTAAGSGTNMSDGLKTALKTWAASATNAGTAESDGSKLNFNGLAYGYYVVTTTQGEQLISVDSTMPDVTVYDKNTKDITVGKTVAKESYSIGDTINYTATFDTVNYYGEGDAAKQVIKYTITDTLPKFLSNVGIDKIVITEADGTTTAATLTSKSFNSDGEVEIAWATEVEGSNPKQWNSIYDNGAKIIVTYHGTLTSVANINTANTNTVKIQPTVVKDDGTTEEPWDEKWQDVAVIKTYAAALKKVDPSKKALAGAKFTIKGLTVEKTSDGVYTVTSYNTAEDAAAGTEMEVDANGMLYIVGLASNVSLTVTETVAPNGYNKLDGTTTLTPQVMAEAIYKLDGYRKYDAKGNIIEETVTKTAEYTQVTKNLSALDAAAVEIVNQSGSELPSTGGMGTTLFYVVGGLMVLAAVVLLVTKKRMASAE